MKFHPLGILHSKIDSTEAAMRLLSSRLSCGFPSPADDYIESMPSLDEMLIKHKAATFFGKASGDSMIERGILDGSLLVIDRSIEPIHNNSIVASVSGELTIKILDLKRRLLVPSNKAHKPIPIPSDIDTICEGVVTYCITPQFNFTFPC